MIRVHGKRNRTGENNRGLSRIKSQIVETDTALRNSKPRPVPIWIAEKDQRSLKSDKRNSALKSQSIPKSVGEKKEKTVQISDDVIPIPISDRKTTLQVKDRHVVHGNQGKLTKHTGSIISNRNRHSQQEKISSG